MRRFGFENEAGTSFEYGIHFLAFPIFEHGKEIVHDKQVAGRLGTVTVRTGMYSDTIIKNELEFQCSNVYEYEEKSRSIRQWLLSTRQVTYSDSEDSFYVVKNVEISGEERLHGVYGILAVAFTCSPSLYLKDGCNEELLKNGNNIIFNPCSLSQPRYRINGNGVCNLTVNGKVLTVNVNGSVTIDSELMIAYMGEAVKNTTLTGRYVDVNLVPGENAITVPAGFTVKITPRWRILS